MRTTIITLTNEFHNSAASVRVPAADAATGRVIITASQAKRAAKKLCGMMDCTCGGIRGGEWIVHEPLADGGLVLARRGTY